MSNKKLSVVIPTLQKNVDLLVNLLATLEKDDVVDEIILIDNSLKGLEYSSAKLKIITPEENLFVNPSWNLGTKEAKNEIVALLNDDISISADFCSKVVEKLTPQMGCVGAFYKNIKETEDILYDVESTELDFKPVNLIPFHWGITIFFYKSSYIEIPNKLKIYRGDDWLFYGNLKQGRQNYYIEGQNIYHWGSLSSGSKNLSAIGRQDRRYYRKLTLKWWQHIFNVERTFDGYCITFFCGKFFYRK